MTNRQAILLGGSTVVLAALLLFMVFSERGLAELNLLRSERDRIAGQNRELVRENISLGVEIDRLKNDPSYIESVARREFGMIGQDELLVKPQRPPRP
ncbi:MAG: septum formation initiator family protein [Desulfobacterales bacterium]